MTMRTSRYPKTGLDGPFQVFRIVYETQDASGQWQPILGSDYFVVELENFGMLSMFMVEEDAMNEAVRLNDQFFKKLIKNSRQIRLNEIDRALPPVKRRLLKQAMELAYKHFNIEGDGFPTPDDDPLRAGATGLKNRQRRS